MPASNLIERVADLVGTQLAEVPPALRPELEELLVRLREPVRIAVVGRVNAGKSTMVNALLGQCVAPTDVSECTRLVTWFHYGHPQRVVIELSDGSSTETQLGPDGKLPDELGVPVEQVRALHCYLANELLKWMTLIDTPGIGSVHKEYSASTEQLLAAEAASSAATRRADAVVFLFNQVVMEDELQALQLFKVGSSDDSSTAQSAANAVGVLAKADQLGDGSRDPWGVALELAGQYAGKFRDEVATVVPVIGLIAESAEAAVLTETDVRHLGELAAMEPKAFERLLWSADRFVSAEAPLDEAARERLLEMLDLYGVRLAVSRIRDGVSAAVPLRRELSGASGIAEVKQTLARYFRQQDHLLKVRSVLEELRRLSYGASDAAGTGTSTGSAVAAGGGASAGELARFRSALEALRLDPEMHPVVELEVLHDCCTGRVSLPGPMLEEITRLFAPGTPGNRLGIAGQERDALAEAATHQMARWRTFMVTEADPAQQRVARVVLRSYQLIWKDLQ
ncbi:MAG TPA: dynamin family protein [Acidimicrobiales bacterium]|nr:dynamin family protein [Acidimicrobiales bacterium]